MRKHATRLDRTVVLVIAAPLIASAGTYAIVSAVFALAAPHPHPAAILKHPPAAVHRFPLLNAPDDDAWLVPIADTRGMGRYRNPRAGWQITVTGGFIGTDTGDDACTRILRGIDSPTDFPYVAGFTLAVRNITKRLLLASRIHLMLTTPDGTRRTSQLDSPVGMTIPWEDVAPGATRHTGVGFGDLPRAGGGYRLMVRIIGDRAATLSTYWVAANGKNPCA